MVIPVNKLISAAFYEKVLAKYTCADYNISNREVRNSRGGDQGDRLSITSLDYQAGDESNLSLTLDTVISKKRAPSYGDVSFFLDFL